MNDRRSTDVEIPERYRHLRMTRAQWDDIKSEARMMSEWDALRAELRMTGESK